MTKNANFGIEIEMTGITREKAAKAIADYFHTESRYVGGTYYAYEVTDYQDRVWKIMRDSSVQPQKKQGGRTVTAEDAYRVEFVTPILGYYDIEELQEIVRALRTAGAFTNAANQGMHVHVSMDGMTAQALRNLVNILASKEDLLYDAIQVNSGRIGYCKKTNQRFLKQLNERKPKTLEELADVWYNGDAEYARTRKYHDSRYVLANLHAFFLRGALEFRMYNATLHAGEVKAAIQFCIALVHQAVTTKKAIYRRTTTDNPKYTFRCWMLRLGLIGDEFKTCRHHFLKNLEGNAAWKEVPSRLGTNTPSA